MRDQHHLAEQLRSHGVADRANHNALVGIIDEAPAAHARGATGCCEHLIQRQAIGLQALRFDLHLELADVPAEGIDLGHTRHTQQVWPESPVGERAQLHRRAVGRSQTHNDRQAGRGGQRSHARRANLLRQAADHLAQPFGDHLPGAEDVSAFVEDERDDRQPLNGLGADGLQARRSVQLGFDGQGYQLFDFLGRKPRRFGLDDHLRRRELREHIQPRGRGNV